MSAPENGGPASRRRLSETQATPGSVEERIRHSFARLIAHSRLMREHARQGDGASVFELLERRSALIQELSSLEDPIPESFRPIFEQLAAEDAETGIALERWRERIKSELQELASSRHALDGYSRLAGNGKGSFQREL